LPDIHFNPEQCSRVTRPRFIKSHFPFSTELHTDKYSKVIYLARDGRDVAVSYYFHLKKLGKISEEMSFEDYIARFNQGTLNKFLSWSKHVESWLDHAPRDFLLFRYEDIKRDPEQKLRQVLQFAGLEVDEKKVIQAVQASRFSNMQKQEQQASLEWLGREVREKFMKSEIPFVRKGRVGTWKEMFADAIHEEFISVQRNAMERLKYIQQA
jgi:hypothetical protein